MIKLDFSLALSGILFIALALVFSPWLFYTFSKRTKGPVAGLKNLIRCPYCAHFFFGYRENALLTCPRCKSFLNREEGNGAPDLPKTQKP